MRQQITYSYQGHRWFGFDDDYVPHIGSCVEMPYAPANGNLDQEHVYVVQNVVVGWQEIDGIRIRRVSVRLK